MAPRKRRVVEEEEKEKLKPELATRLTRSATRRDASINSDNSVAELQKTELPKAKKAKKAVKDVELKVVEEEVEEGTKTIVIEHCKQCNSFKTRAIQVKEGLEEGVTGITVLVNPDKPRRGCFEIREKGGETFISLLDMKRPFTPMKNLDMGEVISGIIDKIK
ncbi:uncharacterized protein LOC115971863 [Quercus lobata]|uniref:Selenoprotein H n=1 Tax=Quercus lobata TaxID=97700 RepID=A0A7N2N494_QUELO|nr:uncharacterized protein LOC115971863 [Quercus lobata]